MPSKSETFSSPHFYMPCLSAPSPLWRHPDLSPPPCCCHQHLPPVPPPHWHYHLLTFHSLMLLLPAYFIPLHHHHHPPLPTPLATSTFLPSLPIPSPFSLLLPYHFSFPPSHCRPSFPRAPPITSPTPPPPFPNPKKKKILPPQLSTDFLWVLT